MNIKLFFSILLWTIAINCYSQGKGDFQALSEILSSRDNISVFADEATAQRVSLPDSILDASTVTILDYLSAYLNIRYLNYNPRVLLLYFGTNNRYRCRFEVPF